MTSPRNQWVKKMDAQFSIENRKEDGFDKVILRDEAAGTRAVIIPSCSALLHAFEVSRNGQLLNVIESYDSREDFEKNVTAKGFLGTKLSPFVCRINNGKYKLEGREFTIEKYYDRGNALHGMLYDQPFMTTNSYAGENYASVTMTHAYRAMDHGFPFHYDCTVTYRLEKDNRLTLTTAVTSHDEVSFPIQDGWHPYFTLGESIDDCELQFTAKEMVEFDERLIPTGNLLPYGEFNTAKKMGNIFFDNCFTLDASATEPGCRLRNGQVLLEVLPQGSYPYLQLYTPAHRKSLAIENISGAPDAFNNGMGNKILLPGQTFTFTTLYKITLLT